jgi:hypothetical protein
MFELALAMRPFVQNNGPMKRLAWAVVASTLLTFSCADSGQTGSAECLPTPLSCECDSLAGKSLVKANVLAIDTGSVILEIEQVLNPSSLLDESAVDSQVDTVLAGSFACDRTRQVAPQVGDTVFAAFLAYPYREPNAPRNVGEAVLSPWSDTVDIGNGRPLAVSDAVTLSDPSTCESKYPRPTTAPCNDTSTIGNCALSDVHPPRSALWLPLLAVLGVAARLASRRR